MNTVVYQWLREDGSPYYIGIGNPKRPYTGKRCCGGPPPKDRIVVLHEGLDWKKACEIERELIEFYGRKDLGTGILRNRTDGGEGARGAIRSEETRAKMSGENHPLYGKTGENNHRYGKKHTEETKEKMSKALSGKNNPMYGKRREDNPNYGRTHTEEAREKMSKALSGENHPMYGKRGEKSHMYGRTFSRETREKMSKSRSGENNPMYGKKGKDNPNHGKKHTEEAKAKMSKAMSGKNNPMYGKTRSEETRKKVSEAVSGKNHPRYTPRNWHHPIHGTVLQKSISDLMEMFPEQNLHLGNLSQVANKKRPHHKRWTIIESPTEV